MKVLDLIEIAVTNIRQRSLRSWLTIIGIVLGVASIITLISVSIGVSQQINSRINTLGSNIISVVPGGQSAQRMGGGLAMPALGGGNFRQRDTVTSQRNTLVSRESGKITFSEADELKKIEGVYKLDTQISGRLSISYKDKNYSTNVIGTDPEAFQYVMNTPLYSGRFLNPSNQYSAVIGFNVANRTFNDLNMLNRQIKIKGITFKIVGILNVSGSSMSSSDGNVYIPLKIAKNLLGENDYVSQITIITVDGKSSDDVAPLIEQKLIDLHRVTVDTEDFQIITAATLQAAVQGIADTMALFLGGIGSISLIVGAIGVANTMFMSVLERTREIGIMKAIGANNGTIIGIFLLESGIIGMLGGMIGISIAYLVSLLLTSMSVPSVITVELTLLGLGFSFLVGIVAGYFPARNAAAVPPMEALRYE